MKLDIIRPLDNGQFQLVLPHHVRTMFGHLAQQLKQVLRNEADPARGRLVRPVYQEDDNDHDDDVDLMARMMVEERCTDVDMVAEMMSEDVIDAEQVAVLAKVANSLRLVLAERLNMTTEDATQVMRLDPDPPAELAMFDLLGVLVAASVEVL